MNWPMALCIADINSQCISCRLPLPGSGLPALMAVFVSASASLSSVNLTRRFFRRALEGADALAKNSPTKKSHKRKREEVGDVAELLNLYNKAKEVVDSSFSDFVGDVQVRRVAR